eukprot:SAG31_NODE_261_length_18904_cov_115.315554_5_plen_78_part_00
MFESASDETLGKIAEVVNMIRLPQSVQVYRESEPGYDAYIVAAGLATSKLSAPQSSSSQKRLLLTQQASCGSHETEI